MRRRRVLGQRGSDLRRRQSPKGPGTACARLLLVALGATVFLLPAGASRGDPRRTAGTVAPIILRDAGSQRLVRHQRHRQLGGPAASGPDDPGLRCPNNRRKTRSTRTCTCTAWWSDGSASGTVHIHRDATPPTVTVTRGPRSRRERLVQPRRRFHLQPAPIRPRGSRACSRARTPARTIRTTPSRARAVTTRGTPRRSSGSALKYDATPPKIKKFDLKARQGGARLHWTNSADVKSVELAARTRPEGCCAERRLPRRRPVERLGRYAASSPGASIATSSPSPTTRPTDDADERLRRSWSATRPGSGRADRRKPPLLVWAAVRGASYYNVVLVRGRRVFSAWPTQHAAEDAARLDVPRPSLQTAVGHRTAGSCGPDSVRSLPGDTGRCWAAAPSRSEARARSRHARTPPVARPRCLRAAGDAERGRRAGHPGDPTPPVVTPHFFGTQGLNGWWVSNVTLNWTVEDPESQILETRGCDAVTLTNDTAGTSFTCYARSDGGETTGHGHDPA